MSSTTKHRIIAESIFQALNSRDFEAFEKVIIDDIIIDFPGAGRAEGIRRTLLLMRSILRKFPQLQFTVSETLVETGRACVVWTNEGIDIHGSQYLNSGMTLVHFQDDKICFISDYFKDTSFVL